MLLELLLVLYAVATGFVVAGLLGSFYQLVTNRHPAFLIATDGLLDALAVVVVCVFAGPFIIMRNAIRGRLIEHRPLGWLAASAVIASGWSLCSGVVVIEVALVIRHAIA